MQDEHLAVVEEEEEAQAIVKAIAVAVAITITMPSLPQSHCTRGITVVHQRLPSHFSRPLSAFFLLFYC